MNLRMELHSPGLPLRILDRRQRAGTLRHHAESRRQLARFVAVRHPHRKRCRQVAKERGFAIQNLDFGVSILAFWPGNNFSTQLVSNEMQSVADAQNGNAQRKDTLVGRGSVIVVHRTRAARKNDSSRMVALDLVEWSSAGEYDREDALFANPARDKLRILRAKVEDDDRLRFHD